MCEVGSSSSTAASAMIKLHASYIRERQRHREREEERGGERILFGYLRGGID